MYFRPTPGSVIPFNIFFFFAARVRYKNSCQSTCPPHSPPLNTELFIVHTFLQHDILSTVVYRPCKLLLPPLAYPFSFVFYFIFILLFIQLLLAAFANATLILPRLLSWSLPAHEQKLSFRVTCRIWMTGLDVLESL